LAGELKPLTDAVTVNVPVVPFAVNVGAVASPEVFVFTVAVVTLPANVPLCPLCGALKRTGIDGTPLPYWSVTVTDIVEYAVPAATDCDPPALTTMEFGVPAEFVKLKPGLVESAPTVAVTVYVPAMVLAWKAADCASPDALVVACVWFAAKVRLAPVVGAEKVTV
jgi:hypothetical protein